MNRLYQAVVLSAAVGLFSVTFQEKAPAQQQFAQVTSVSELSDVTPDQWYFQALQSLVERYGCIAGYPDGTFRGQRAMTRGEFAAGLNACLDRINELIAAGLADKVSRQDLATVQRLQEEFAAELTALTGRVDALEAKAAELEANPLGLNVITSKLGFEIISGIFAASEVVDGETNNAQVPYRVRMTFDSSFTGEDRLRVRLQSREADSFTGDPVGFDFDGNSAGGGSTGEDVELDDVYYRYPLFGDRVTALFGINSVDATDLHVFETPFKGISEFGEESELTHDIDGEAAFIFSWEAIEELFYVTYGYGADDAAGNDFGSGLFAGETSHALELAATPTDSLTLALAGSTASSGQTDGSDFNGQITSVSFSVAWEITPRVIFSGWYARGFNSTENGDDASEADFDDWLVGFSFPDLFIEGANGGFFVGSPDSFVGLSDQSGNFLSDTDTVSADTVTEEQSPFLAEIYYSFPLTETISLTPGVYYITGLNDDDDDIVVGGVQVNFRY